MAVRGRGSLKFLQDTATLSKEELSKMEKDAERRTADRKKLKESGKKAPSGTRRAKVQARRAAQRNIPKAVRDLMISEKQDKQNKGDSKLRSQNRGKVSKSGVGQSIKSATDKARPSVKSAASRVGKLAKGMTGVGALLTPSEIGVGKGESRSMAEEIAKGTRDANLARLKKQMADAKKSGERKKKSDAEIAANKKLAEGVKKGVIDRRTVGDNKKTENKSKSTKSDAPAGPPRTIAEAKRRGLDYFVGKDGKRKAAVTAEELKASGLSLRDYLNKKQGKTRKMAKGGYANCGASMKPTQKSSQRNK